MVKGGSSYLSQSELVLTFGLGGKTQVASARIEWPSGKTDQLTNIAADQTITVEEGKGIVSAKQFSKAAQATASPMRRVHHAGSH
jgi:hypothetical protein